MAMTNRANIKRDGLIMSTLDDLVPQDHLVRTLEATIDWKFIYPLVKSLYSNFGRRSIDPVILFKMIFINYTFGINSMRKTCEEIKVNIAYRWFLGISIYEDVPNHSTWSKNYQRRYKDRKSLTRFLIISSSTALITALLIPLLSLAMAHIEKLMRILEKLQIGK